MDESQTRKAIYDAYQLLVDTLQINNIPPSVGVWAMVTLVGRTVSTTGNQEILENVKIALQVAFDREREE